MPRLGLGISLGKVTTQAAAVLVVNDFAWKSFKSGELTFPFAGILTQDIKYSNVFTNTSNWQQATGDGQSNLTIGADTTIEDPFNGTSSFKITYDRSGYSFLRQNVGTATSSTFSIYVKKIDHRYIGIRNHDDSSLHSVFDFDTETFVRTQTGHVLTFEKIGLTGWYRLFDYHEAGASEASPFQGIAITDPLQIVASGLTTVDTNALIDFLKNLIALNSSIHLSWIKYPFWIEAFFYFF